MTQAEQLALADAKIEHWRGKCEHAASMLSKWESRLKGLQSKKVVPTAKTLPKVDIVAGTECVMPRAAIKTSGDLAAAEHLARETALRDMAEEAGESGDKVVSIKGSQKRRSPKSAD